MSQMYCVPVSETYELSGYEGDDDDSKFEIQIKRCNGAGCSSAADFDTFMDTFLDANDYFKVRLYIVDTIFSLEDPEPVQETIEKDIFLSFTDTLGSRGTISFATY